jgi:hypothetical protein
MIVISSDTMKIDAEVMASVIQAARGMATVATPVPATVLLPERRPLRRNPGDRSGTVPAAGLAAPAVR